MHCIAHQGNKEQINVLFPKKNQSLTFDVRGYRFGHPRYFADLASDDESIRGDYIRGVSETNLKEYVAASCFSP